MYNDLIGIWTDYFNNLFSIQPPLDPDMVKALIGSESDFKINPKNPLAIGIAQITKETHRIIKDPKGEIKDFIFIKISQKDLKNPDISIPVAVRWLAHKRTLAAKKLSRTANHEEIILECKGLLKSKTEYKATPLKGIKNFMKNLKSKSFLTAFILLVTNCVSQKKFEIKKILTNPTYDDLHIVKIQPDRIIQECLFLDAEAENKWRHQYSMFILNDNHEVIPITYSIHLEKSVCLEHAKKVDKILKNTSEVTHCLRDKFTKDPDKAGKSDPTKSREMTITRGFFY